MRQIITALGLLLALSTATGPALAEDAKPALPGTFNDAPGYPEISYALRTLAKRGDFSGIMSLAVRGNPMAMTFLATVYADGLHAPRDCVLARQWLDRAIAAIPTWGASEADQIEFRHIVTFLGSDPEKGIPKWCPHD